MRELIHMYIDGNQWCAIFPMGSNIMDCKAVAFSPVNKTWSDNLERFIDYGKYAVLKELRRIDPAMKQYSYYCEQI